MKANGTRSSPNERAALGIGYVPQGRGIFPQLSVRDTLLFAWHEYSGGSQEQVIDAILKDFPRLVPLLDREGGALSGGEQQLLALARCLVGDPEFLLLDEPTEGIQPSIIEEIAKTPTETVTQTNRYVPHHTKPRATVILRPSTR